MFLDQWIRFTWNLKQLPEQEPAAEGRVRLRQLDERDDLPRIWRALERAYATDPGWGSGRQKRLTVLRKAVFDGVGEARPKFFVMEDGSRMVGVSGWSAQTTPELLTGICIVEEYRCRGYGALLLHATLKQLAKEGLARASVVTKTKINASKFLYPKFDSTSELVSEEERVPQIKEEAKAAESHSQI